MDGYGCYVSSLRQMIFPLLQISPLLSQPSSRVFRETMSIVIVIACSKYLCSDYFIFYLMLHLLIIAP